MESTIRLRPPDRDHKNMDQHLTKSRYEAMLQELKRKHYSLRFLHWKTMLEQSPSFTYTEVQFKDLLEEEQNLFPMINQLYLDLIDQNLLDQFKELLLLLDLLQDLLRKLELRRTPTPLPRETTSHPRPQPHTDTCENVNSHDTGKCRSLIIVPNTIL